MASRFMLDDSVRICQREKSSVSQAQREKLPVSSESASITESKEFETGFAAMKHMRQNSCRKKSPVIYHPDMARRRPLLAVDPLQPKIVSAG